MYASVCERLGTCTLSPRLCVRFESIGKRREKSEKRRLTHTQGLPFISFSFELIVSHFQLYARLPFH